MRQGELFFSVAHLELLYSLNFLVDSGRLVLEMCLLDFLLGS